MEAIDKYFKLIEYKKKLEKSIDNILEKDFEKITKKQNISFYKNDNHLFCQYKDVKTKLMQYAITEFKDKKELKQLVKEYEISVHGSTKKVSWTHKVTTFLTGWGMISYGISTTSPVYYVIPAVMLATLASYLGFDKIRNKRKKKYQEKLRDKFMQGKEALESLFDDKTNNSENINKLITEYYDLIENKEKLEESIDNVLEKRFDKLSEDGFFSFYKKEDYIFCKHQDRENGFMQYAITNFKDKKESKKLIKYYKISVDGYDRQKMLLYSFMLQLPIMASMGYMMLNIGKIEHSKYFLYGLMSYTILGITPLCYKIINRKKRAKKYQQKLKDKFKYGKEALELLANT